MKNLLYFCLTLIFCFSFKVVADPNQIDVSKHFINKYEEALKIEYQYILDNSSTSQSLASLLDEMRQEWNDLYNNTNLSLKDDDCGFWIALIQLDGSYSSDFSDNFFERAVFINNILIGKESINDNLNKFCRVWLNESQGVSMIELINSPSTYEDKLISVKGYFYKTDGLGALFFSKEHFISLDLNNAIMINSGTDINEFHGSFVWLEGRYFFDKCRIRGRNRHCVKMGRIIKAYPEITTLSTN